MIDDHSLEDARLALASAVLFRAVTADPVVKAFIDLLDSGVLPLPARVERYAGFAALLYRHSGNWSEYLLGRVLRDENRYMLLAAAGEEIPDYLNQALARELPLFERASQITPEQMGNAMGCPIPLAGWRTEQLDFAAAYHRHLANIGKTGYGIFSEHHVFMLRDGALVPVRHPDTVSPDKLTGYQAEREKVMANTRALIEGRPAANALLYGDSGTGKSTCVKSVANALKDEGLRLIELQKDQLNQIPMLIDRLSKNPLKFIIFIDDLSFSGNSDGFSAMKAVLEGSVSAKAANMVIYATSNRRHLVRETFSQRDGDEIHLRDTIEETSSLSDRFGLLVTFMRPDKDLYLSIVESYCKKYSIDYDDGIRCQAEAFALRRGGRSARTARQFTESLPAATI